MFRQRVRLLQLKKVAIQPNLYILVAQQHVLENSSVSSSRQRLPRIGKVPIVCRRPTRQPQQHARVQLLRVFIPLLLRVMFKHGFVQERPDSAQRRFLSVPRLSVFTFRHHSLLVVPLLHLFVRVYVGAKQRVHRLSRRRYRNQFQLFIFIFHASFHPMIERHPLREVLHVLPHSFEIRVE